MRFTRRSLARLRISRSIRAGVGFNLPDLPSSLPGRERQAHPELISYGKSYSLNEPGNVSRETRRINEI